ncbi:hypothetical protein [Andreprevotia chitinilytica]|uniref:hypothetical protein n=1 Tax=Andreprevotia chitinilytica TaxID=396808 RepID=UPI0005532F92|nr:hypothetical protein [Andreprevotia chitinilytica]
MRRRTISYLKRHGVVALIVMAVAFIGFASFSVNLLMVLHANLSFIWEHGWFALRLGALEQLIGLLFSGVAALLFYLLFKTCEKLLVEKISDTATADKPKSEPATAPPRDAKHG